MSRRASDTGLAQRARTSVVVDGGPVQRREQVLVGGRQQLRQHAGLARRLDQLLHQPHQRIVCNTTTTTTKRALAV